MMSATDMRGDSEPNGSWNTICMSRRNGRISLNLQALDLACRGRRSARPRRSAAGCASPSVVLPEPDSPTTPSVSPLRTSMRDAVDRLDVADHLAQHAALDRKPDLEIVGLDHDRRVRLRRRRIGLAARRRAVRGCRDASGAVKTRSTAPCSTILPCFITQTRSAILRTMPRSWVMNSIAMPRRAWISFSSFRICACTVTSSAVVGSSAISRSGSLASAMAIITRWRWPPDSWCG